MAIIPTVGRKTLSMRILIACLYAALSIGAATMVYPFLVMLSTSVKSSADINDFAVLPKFFVSESALFSKYAEIKYAGDINVIDSYYAKDFAQFENVEPPQKNHLSAPQKRMIDDWDGFCADLPMVYRDVNFQPIPGTAYAPSPLLDKYRRWLAVRFNNDILALNKQYQEENSNFMQVFIPFERSERREWQPGTDTKTVEWQKFLRTLPPDYFHVVGCDPFFVSFLKQDKYDDSIKKLNAAWGTKYTDFAQAHLAPTLPSNPGERADWEEFMRTMMPFRFMKLSNEAAPAYREFISKRYLGKIGEYNRIYATAFTSFDQTGLPKVIPSEGTPLTDWMGFISNAVPATAFRAVNVENLYRDRIFAKYGNQEAVNKAYGMNMNRMLDLPAPYQLADWSYVVDHHRYLRQFFIGENYTTVLNFLLLHGRAVFNTFIFCLAVILTQLTVNPLCAYALSRYNLKYAYKVLLFLLATMAFPAEVAMIPNFLLLKHLHLLNTFWALILPGMAGGFSIFLLKGFFDSLPRELYEAGIIDGASEPRMFWQITIPLSKPIFAVIALQSFVATYGAFMFAFLVCQDQKMWTMMVWLYELQITAPKYVTMAALSVAALPTLLVFIFAQNIIMRGIILPSYK